MGVLISKGNVCKWFALAFYAWPKKSINFVQNYSVGEELARDNNIDKTVGLTTPALILCYTQNSESIDISSSDYIHKYDDLRMTEL